MFTAKDVVALREKTGAGMGDCKNALEKSNGDIDKAVDFLREKGLASAAKRAGRVASMGMVDSYIHMGGKIGVLVEVNCETDFAGGSDDFKAFVHDVALQIAAANPTYLKRDEVPASILEHEKEVLKAQALNEGKPEKIIDKMVEGRVVKFYKDNCLMEQVFVKNPDLTIQDLMNGLVAKIGEKVEIRRFTRYELGDGLKTE